MEQALKDIVIGYPIDTRAVLDFEVSEVCEQLGRLGVPVSCDSPGVCPIPIYPRSAKATWCNDADGTANERCSDCRNDKGRGRRDGPACM